MIPRLHIITDDEILSRRTFPGQAREVLAAGGEGLALHLRGPRSQGGFLFRTASELMDSAGAAGARLLVNDRLDVALALRLPGVHLGQRSLPPRVARGLLGPDGLLGVSVHGREEMPPWEEDVDYLLVGTLFATPSHPEAVPGGLERMESLRSLTSLPLVGIGGISPDRVSPVLAAGGHGVAVRGGIWNAPDPVEAVGVFLDGVGSGLAWGR